MEKNWIINKKPFVEINRDEIIKEGAFQSFKGNEPHPIRTKSWIGKTPNERFELGRIVYNPFEA